MASREQRLDWLHVGDDETIEWIGHPSIYPTAGALVGFSLIGLVCIAIAVLLAVGSFGLGLPPVLTLAPLGLVLLLVFAAIWKYYVWRFTYYAITSSEIYKKSGIIGRDVTQVGYEQVQNTNYNQSVLERLLSFSDISIYTAGTNLSELRLNNTPNPGEIQELITSQLKKKRDSDQQEIQSSDPHNESGEASDPDVVSSSDSPSSESDTAQSDESEVDEFTESSIYD